MDALTTDTFSAERLIGTQVRLWPYVRGLYPRDALLRLWQTMEAEGAGPKIFHGYHEPIKEGVSTAGDITEFVTYFADPRRVVLAVTPLDSDQILGMVWFEEIIPQFRACINIWYTKDAFGAKTLEGTHLACRYAFEALGVQTILGFTPWPAAVAHGEKLGFQLIATLPQFIWQHPHPLNLYIVRLTREEFADGD